ncbi:MAG: hypothetical protein GY750_07715 [Lentisphaerae bacterium]|nr:hypothetical protein [Lentisphaerota bacterium]MCP4101293.1 hypothetical protein [Lentisphaerota bacterium]
MEKKNYRDQDLVEFEYRSYLRECEFFNLKLNLEEKSYGYLLLMNGAAALAIAAYSHANDTLEKIILIISLGAFLIGIILVLLGIARLEGFIVKSQLEICEYKEKYVKYYLEKTENEKPEFNKDDSYFTITNWIRNISSLMFITGVACFIFIQIRKLV